MKDVSIRLRGKYREDLSAIQDEWPVPQVDVVGAALRKFRELPVDQQAEAFRGTTGRSRRRDRSRRSVARQLVGVGGREGREADEATRAAR